MLTGFYQVQPGNQGVVQRFGKHVETVGDGWGWRLPWPIETVTKVDVAGVKSIAYKSRVLTAEPNMVELQVAVQYRITRAEDYLFRVREPIATLGEVSESAIREVVGRNDQQAILEAGRIKIAEDTRVIMQRTLDQYGAGIEVRSVNITDVQVPEAVQQAQRDSVKAQGRPRTHDQGSAGLRERHHPGGARATRRAPCRKPKRTSRRSCRWPPAMPRGSRSWPIAYEKAPNVTRERLYIEAVESVLKSSRKVIIDSKSGNGNMLYLPLDKLMERRDGDGTVTVRPPVAVEPDPSLAPIRATGWNADGLAHSRNPGGAAGAASCSSRARRSWSASRSWRCACACRRSWARTSSPACSSRSRSWTAWSSSTAACSRASSTANSS